jgi:hypothetical protein
MPETSKPFVRLAAKSAAKEIPEKPAPAPKDPNIKLAIRLNEGVNEALRTLIRYRGDLSTMALEALRSVDLTRVALVSAEERMVRDTTITMSRQLHKRLKNIADDRATSMNILVNTALAHWLASKGALRVG